MKTLWKIGVIGVVPLILGLAFNQITPRGIPWRLLVSPFSSQARRNAWKPVATDSAFVMFMDGSTVFLDIRPKPEFLLDHIPNAQSVPFFDVFKNPVLLADLDSAASVLVYDFEPLSNKSRLVVQQLQHRGISNVGFLRNGFKEWLEYSFPVEKGETP